jgi:glycogen debranching enzyme
MRIYKQSAKSFIERLLIGYEAELTSLCIGTIPELFDGNPPYKGHGGMSFAMSVSQILKVLEIMKKAEGVND